MDAGYIVTWRKLIFGRKKKIRTWYATLEQARVGAELVQKRHPDVQIIVNKIGEGVVKI